MNVEQYKQQGKPELQALAGKRELPTSGTKEELAERLAAWDEQNPTLPIQVTEDADTDLEALKALTDPLPPVSSTVQQTGGPPDPPADGTGAAPDGSGAPDVTPPDDPADAGVDGGEAMQEPPEQHRPVTYKYQVELEAEFTDELHDRYRRQAHAAAVEAGKTPRVGPFGARLLGISDNIATYEVPIRRS